MSIIIHHYGMGEALILAWGDASGLISGRLSDTEIEASATDADLDALALKHGWYLETEGAPARLLALIPAQGGRPLLSIDYRKEPLDRLDRESAMSFGHVASVDYRDPASGDVVVTETYQYWPESDARTTGIGPICRLMDIGLTDANGAHCASKQRYKAYVRLKVPITRNEGETWAEYAARFEAAANVNGAIAEAGQSITAGRRRRQTVIDDLALTVVVVIKAATGADATAAGVMLATALGGADTEFVRSGGLLYAAVRDMDVATYQWIDAVIAADGTTLRAKLLADLDPWWVA